MLKVLFDEDFDGPIQNGIRRRRPELDTLRCVDVGLSGREDPDVLALAALEGRVMISHDVRTMPGFALDRVNSGLPMPGLFIVPRRLSRRDVIEELLVLIEDSIPEDWNGVVAFLPILYAPCILCAAPAHLRKVPEKGVIGVIRRHSSVNLAATMTADDGYDSL